ncbi:MAG: type IV pilus biogenesis/stability protein PilW [Colwellia sp.]|nr:type IV pilus biogenesis/stability protein PilW [Colwellia sp.]
MAKYIFPTILTAISISLLSGCVTQSFENNEPIVKNKANRDEMAATRVALGLGYLKMGDMSQAKLNLEKAKGFSPNLVQVHTAFAHYYETVGESELAINSFEQALAIKADSADTLNNYGVFLCRQGKLAAAEVQFLKAIAVPSYILVSQSYENLASCYLQNDDFEKAEMYLNKAIFHSPNRTRPLLQMVRMQYAMTDYKEAKRFLHKFERHTRRFTADSLALAYKLYWKLGQRRTATNYANMLVKMYPQSWEGKQYLLNDLEFIEADDLARKYQVSQREKNQLPPSRNKRVVKLSPRKVNNSPYTTSVKTASLAKSSNELVGVAKIAKVPTAATVTAAMTATPVVVATPAVAAMPIVTTTPQLATNATQVVLGSGTALLSATVAGTVVATSMPITDSTVFEPNTTLADAEEINTISKDVVDLAPAITAVVATGVVATQSVIATIEPNSTKPIPATRDVPLPEALPQQAEIEVLVAEAGTPEADFIKAQANVDEAPLTTIPPVLAAASVATVVEAEVLVNNIEKVDAKDAFHTVSPGENLYNISVIYNVKLNALRKWNNISEKNKIHIGDKLYVVDPQTVKNIND